MANFTQTDDEMHAHRANVYETGEFDAEDTEEDEDTDEPAE